MGEGKAILRGRRIIITGATRGIGRAIALEFSKESASLVLVGRDKAKLEEVRPSLPHSPSLLSLRNCSFTVSASIEIVCLSRWQVPAKRLEQRMSIACRYERTGSEHGL